MSSPITLTAKELYFLGKILQANYIDYAYIAAMPGIQQRYRVHEQQAVESLEDKGLLEEDFGGEIEVSEEAEALFAPMFFGETEYLLDNGKVWRIHQQDGQCTIALLEGENIQIQSGDDRALEALLHGAVRLQCSNVRTGVSEMTYTADQMRSRDARKRVLEYIKGGN